MSDGNRQPCPKCGALNYLADDICVSCGYDLLPVVRLDPLSPDEVTKVEASSAPSERSQVGDVGERELTEATRLGPRCGE